MFQETKIKLLFYHIAKIKKLLKNKQKINIYYEL